MEKKKTERKKAGSQKPLDVQYLGRKLPGNPQERQKLLAMFKNILEEEGPDYVFKHRQIFLESAKDILLDLQRRRQPLERRKYCNKIVTNDF